MGHRRAVAPLPDHRWPLCGGWIRGGLRSAHRAPGRRAGVAAADARGSAAALVDDLLRPAVAGANHLALGLRVLVDDVEREALYAVLLDLGFDFALELVAVLPHRLRPRTACAQAQHHCCDDQLAHFFPLAARSQLAPLNLRTLIDFTVPGSRQRAFTLYPSGCDRGT